jgi:hypothetical protein
MGSHVAEVTKGNEGPLEIAHLLSGALTGHLLSSSRHDPFDHRDRIGNCRFQKWRRSSIPPRQLAGGEDAGSDQQNSLATLIHSIERSIFAFSSLY